MARLVKWTAPTTYTDGRPYGQADHGGYELELNSTPAIAVPVAWNDSGKYEFDLSTLSTIQQGTNSVRMRTVAANGQVSEWTPSVTFPFLSVPQAPLNVAVN